MNELNIKNEVYNYEIRVATFKSVQNFLISPILYNPVSLLSEETRLAANGSGGDRSQLLVYALAQFWCRQK